MASLLSPRRTASETRRRSRRGITLEATVPLVRTPGPPPAPEHQAVIGWPIAAVVGAAATALFGWVLMAGFAVVGWLAAEPGSLAGALGVGTQFWLLAHGAGARLGATEVTLIPWGATAVFAVMLSRFAGFATRQVREPGRAAVVRVVAVTTLTYLGIVVGASVLFGATGQLVRAAAVAGAVAAVASAWGSCRASGYDPTAGWPTWSRAVPRAVLGAALVMLTGGVAALVAALINELGRVEQLTRALDTGVAGGVALLVVQLAFAPNLVIWAASYTVGAGFSLGPGVLVSPAETHLGLLPGVPVLGALPAEGPGHPMQLLWLAVGVGAGALAAWLVTRARPAARFDETSLVGGLAGVLAGLLFVGFGWASSGDLGTLRLVALGPNLLVLAAMAVTVMGLSGLVVGLVLDLLRRPRG